MVTIINPPFMQRLELSKEEKTFWSSFWNKTKSPDNSRLDSSQIEKIVQSNVRGNAKDVLTFDLLEIPMWYVHLSAVLASAGVSYKLVDLNFLSGPELKEDAVLPHLNKDCDNIYLLSAFTNNIHFATTILGAIRTKIPDAIVIMGGPHVTCTDEEILRSGVDFVVRGEGEKTLEELIPILQQEKDPAEVKGITFMRNNKLVRTPNREPIRDLDSLPLPNYDILPTEYRQTFYTRLFTSRGCPMHCAFCSDVLWNNQFVRKKSLNRIQQELDIIKKHINFVELYVSDDTFSVDKQYSMAVAEVLKTAEIDWSCETRVDMITPELLAHYKKCGCVGVDYGAESAVQKVLDASHKKTRVEQIERAFRMTKNAGLTVHANWMIGLPADTPEHSKQTIEFACRMLDNGLLDTADYFITVPYPGTPIVTTPEIYGYTIKTRNWASYREDSIPVFDLKDFPAEQIYAIWKEGLVRIADSMQRGGK